MLFCYVVILVLCTLRTQQLSIDINKQKKRPSVTTQSWQFYLMPKCTTYFELSGHYQVLIINKTFKENYVKNRNFRKDHISFIHSMRVWGFRTISNPICRTRVTSGIEMWYEQVVQNDIMFIAVFFSFGGRWECA